MSSVRRTRSAAKRKAASSPENAPPLKSPRTPVPRSSQKSNGTGSVGLLPSSPRRRATNSDDFAEGSPARVERAEEKQELQALNKRLEMYIMKVRTLQAEDDSSRRGDLQAARHLENQLKLKDQTFKDTLDQVRATRDQHQADLLQAQAQNKRDADRIERLERESAEDKDRIADLVAKNKDLGAQLAAETVKRTHAEDELESAERELRHAQGSVDRLQKEVTRARNDQDDAAAKLAQVEAERNALESDRKLADRAQDDEIKGLKAELKDLYDKHGTLEADLRKDFARQLEEILEERHDQNEREKEDALAALKKVYDAKIEAYQDELEELGKRLFDAQQKARAMKEAAERAQDDLEKQLAENDVLAAKLDNAEKVAQKLKDRPAEALDQQNKIIRRMKEAYQRKESEFDELMDVKIALAMEIKAYRQMLESEEERLGIQPKGAKKRKKRKRGDEKEDAPSEEGSVRITAMDLEGQHLKVRNTSTETVSLRGWSLWNEDKSFVFNFPNDLTLIPGQSVLVRAGADAEKDAAPGDLVWTTDDVWNSSDGDLAQLANADEEVVSAVEVIPTQGDADTSCSIM